MNFHTMHFGSPVISVKDTLLDVNLDLIEQGNFYDQFENDLEEIEPIHLEFQFIPQTEIFIYYDHDDNALKDMAFPYLNEIEELIQISGKSNEKNQIQENYPLKFCTTSYNEEYNRIKLNEKSADKQSFPHPIEEMIIPNDTNDLFSSTNLNDFCLKTKEDESFQLPDLKYKESNDKIKKTKVKKEKEILKIKNIEDTNDTNQKPGIIVDESVINIPQFRTIFRDCRVIIRNLNSADFEINHRNGIIIQNINTSKVAEASIVYENVYLFTYGNDQNAEIFIGLSNIKYRKFYDIQSVLSFVVSMIDTNQTFLKESESLHEYILSLFPTISKSLAQFWLRKCNPILDKNEVNGIPEMNYCPFHILLDGVSIKYQQYINTQKNKKGKKRSSSKSGTIIPGQSKIIAPKNGISQYLQVS